MYEMASLLLYSSSSHSFTISSLILIACKKYFSAEEIFEFFLLIIAKFMNIDDNASLSSISLYLSINLLYIDNDRLFYLIAFSIFSLLSYSSAKS